LIVPGPRFNRAGVRFFTDWNDASYVSIKLIAKGDQLELRHLRYFVAVVQCKGYREASRRLHVAQPAISQTVADLERELGLKLFSRTKRAAQVTPEGEVFYAEALRTLAQAEIAITTAKRAAKGEIGRLSIGFLGSATHAFLPELVRKYKAQYPGVKLALYELTPIQQESAFDREEIDIAFTRALTPEQTRAFSSRCLYRDPLMVVLPWSRAIATKRVRIPDLANESFILFHREGSPGLFDTITSVCNKAGFSPRVENEPNMMQTVLSLVEAEQGVAIVPACVRNLRAEGARFYRLQPDEVRVELVAAWKKQNESVVLRTFLDLLNVNAAWIRKKAEPGQSD
jgi:DNA-binding transcriptional LysR family regulator